MPRKPRLDFPDTTHHLFNRGNGKQPIFVDDADRLFFIRRLAKLKAELDFRIFALCLMGNHFHLAIQRGVVPINKILHRLLTAHARFFNDKWQKVGHTFQGRYGSRPVKNDTDLMGLIRYIHMNPVEAGLADRPESWPWSGHEQILTGAKGIVDADLVRDLFGRVEGYRAFMRQPQPKHEKTTLQEIAGAAVSEIRGDSTTREAVRLRTEFIEAALSCGYRRSEIAAYLGRTRAAVTMCLKRI